ncbi:PEP-CTERM sorting domain-containing protein [Crocosphaera sp. Alani8]|uniref:PEP-CTERM sorting domain-containing protein n=1 Tax=Crocosphaera sp. Alani8 TaxID=3038952 RepID=UPI00313ADE52
MILDLDMVLNDAGVDARYGLVGYGTNQKGGGPGQDPYQNDVGGDQFGTASEFSTAADGLVASGGIEDGYEAIIFALNNYTIRSNAVLNIVLVTDEDRDVTTLDSYDSVLAALTDKGAILNAVVNNPLGSSSSNLNALGIDGNDAFFADGNGDYNTQAGNFVGNGAGNTENDYVPMALATEGAVWNLNQLRVGGLTGESFTKAFVDIQVQETVPDTRAVPEPTTVLGLLAFGGGCLLSKKNKFKQ